jgi:hypothetical protein
LRLADCFRIEGHGPEPLRGSRELAAIDLSLVGRYESPRITYDDSLSIAKVTPICQFEHYLQFPKSWRENFPLGMPYLQLLIDTKVFKQNALRSF